MNFESNYIRICNQSGGLRFYFHVIVIEKRHLWRQVKMLFLQLNFLDFPIGARILYKEKKKSKIISRIINSILSCISHHPCVWDKWHQSCAIRLEFNRKRMKKLNTSYIALFLLEGLKKICDGIWMVNILFSLPLSGFVVS